MIKSLLLQIACAFLFAITGRTQTISPKPTTQQLAWHEMEYYLFFHFGPNTFTGAEWGHGNESEAVFNPTSLDCDQWVRLAKAAGAKGVIITAKHHDGFCLWPSQFSTHTVKESKWRDGKGDVLKELSGACKKAGLKFGVYLSPWDRNHPLYGTPEYNTVFVQMMTELFANYGPIYELWWDGANGEGPNGKRQVYDWPLFIKTVRSLSPNTLVFSDVGPDIRWVGNEKGIAGKTNWNRLNTDGFEPGAGAPSTDSLNTGNVFGKYWIPAECDVSIRPGWFYHDAEDSQVKTAETLFDLYLKSVGRGANLLLNVPPNEKGLIGSTDSVALMNFHKLLKENFKEDLALKATRYIAGNGSSINAAELKVNSDGSVKMDDGRQLLIRWKEPTTLNCLVLKESIVNGQSVAGGFLEITGTNGVKKIPFSTIGRKRVITFPSMRVSAVKIWISKSIAPPLLKSLEAYHIDEGLIEK